jgi:AcrR family transcriptional regulator
MAGTRQAPDRSAQKARTRQAIVAAAADLLRRGQQPTVAAAAAEAGVHRATAYRYFPTPRLLLADAALQVITPDFDRVFAQGHFAGVDPADPAGLMDAAVRTMADLMFKEEATFRNIVRVTVDRWFSEQERPDPDPDAIRQTRRFEWIDHALAPLRDRLAPGQFGRLRYALTLVFGAEALVVLRDVCRLGPEEATEIMRWAAATLVSNAGKPDPGATEPPATHNGPSPGH